MSNPVTEDRAKRAKEFDDFVKLVTKAKAARRLHPSVEVRLTALLARLYPNDCAVSEVTAVLGGRNDLIQFSFNGRRAVFELFFSPSQVPQDLRLLERAEAEVKIAILLDHEVNPKLADAFFHKKPDHFPYLWLSELMMSSKEAFCLAKLRELVDEDASIIRLRRILYSPSGQHYETKLRKHLARIEADINNEKASNEELPEITVGQYAVLQIISEIRKMSIPNERLRALEAWLQENIGSAFRKVAIGLQAFLVTDLKEQYAIWAAGDFADALIIGDEENDRAQIVICLNKIINDLYEELNMDRRLLQFHFIYSYREAIS
jgi:hypothetical protein